jgi:hypothetical protein
VSRPKLKKIIDRPAAALILDVEERELIKRTLVVLSSEFSGDAVAEGTARPPVAVPQPSRI